MSTLSIDIVDNPHTVNHTAPLPTNPHWKGNKKPHRNSVLLELREMQTVLYRAVVNPETADVARAQLARAYDALEARRNILRMRPAPKPIDVAKPPRKKPPASPTLEAHDVDPSLTKPSQPIVP